MEKKSSPQSKASKDIGTLILAGNSLGLPEDIPERTKSFLRTSALLIFEEDRVARQTLKAAGVHRPYSKLNEHHQDDAVSEAKKTLKKGQDVCYVSDQGMPNVADPGRLLLQLAYQMGAKVTVIPGPSSITAALAACPFSHEPFVFQGFLAKKPPLREADWLEIKKRSAATVILETPYRRRQLLSEAAKHLGKKHQALLAVDISGPNEAFLSGSLFDIERKSEGFEKLNFVLILAAP